MKIWKPYSAATAWVFVSLSTTLSRSSVLFSPHRQSYCVKSKSFRFSKQGHVKGGNTGMWMQACLSGDTRWLRLAKGCGDVSNFSHELEKGHVGQRQGGANESGCSRERHKGRWTDTVQEREHIYLSLLWCIASLSFSGEEKKMCAVVADEWLRSQESGRAELSLRHREGTMIISWLSGLG